MKKIILIGIVAIGLIFTSCKGDKGQNDTSKFEGVKTVSDSLSYFFGSTMKQNLSMNLKQSGMDVEISVEAIIKGIRDAQKGDSLLVSDIQGKVIMSNLQMAARAKQQASAQSQSQPKIAAGEAFLNAKSAEKDVVTLPSGLRYKILTKGNGAIPTASDRVRAHYHGTLIDGTVFDSSVERNQPFEFSAGGGVIKGWLEVAKLMPVGSKWEIYLPYTLAYGARGSGPKIGPYETLIFQIELLNIIK